MPKGISILTSMKLKYRLIIAFLIITVVPVLLFLTLGSLFDVITIVSAQFFILAFIILLVTAVILFGWIYMSLAPKLHMLTKAADNIKNGNLDFSIEVTGEDEISQVCNSFEEMRQRLETSARENLKAEAEQKALISNIAHDLKTPITAIKGYAEGILDGVADTPEKQEKYLRTIYNKANDMNTLINELTLYTKIDTNRIPYNFTKLNVSDYFGQLIEDTGMDLENQHVTLDYTNCVDEDVIIIGDREQLGRVFGNIISNSIKYMRASSKPHINVLLKDVGDFIQIEIADNGKGIASKDLPYVFDRFYRADASRNSAAGGSGIGLSIVKKIIEDHGGQIWVTSKENEGTTMIFVLRKYQEVVNEQNIVN